MPFSSPRPRRARPSTRSNRWKPVALLAVAATAAAGAVLTVTSPSSAEVPNGWHDVAHDSFNRSAGSGWGSAELGGSYALSTSNSTASTSGSAAVATLSSGSSMGATLSKVSAVDLDISDTFTLDAGSATKYDIFASWAARQQGAGSGYTARVRFSETGKANLAVSRKNGSTSTTLASVDLPFAVKAGVAVRGEFQVTGTSPVAVRARVWLAGSTRPGWQIQYSDSSGSRLQSRGTVGLWNYAQSASAPVKMLRDNLSVGSSAPISAAASTPQPTTPTTPPTATPTPTTPPATPTTSGNRGTTVGTASYAIPSGALFVANNGSDSNAGTEGSPLKTVGAAVNKASSGKTIVLRGGTYHESVTVPNNKTLTIQNYPKEAAWFDGSVPVSNWTKTGTTWVASGWTAEFGSSMGGDAAFKARFINANPMAADADQVFLSGSQLKQVASGSTVGAGQFSVNDAANTITIGSDPGGKEVRASNLQQAFSIAGPSSTIQGVGIRRYATTFEVGAAVRLSSTGGTLRDVVITDNAMQGVAMSNNNKLVDHVVVTNNGQLGIGGTENDNSTIKNSVVSNNNTQDFKDAPVSGGIKITRSRGITVANTEVEKNLSAGIWFDASCYDVKVVGNDVQGNRSTQIEVEVSAKAIVANNTAFGGTTGILLYNTSDAKVFNNEVGGSSLFGIKLAQDARRQATAAGNEALDTRRPRPDPTVTWVVQNIQISNNAFGNGGYFQFYVLDGETHRSADSMNINITGNLFNKRVNKNPAQPTMVAWGQGDNHTLTRWETPAEMKAAKGWTNAQTPDTMKIADMKALMGSNASTAVALPSDVASAAGLTAGSKKIGTY